MSHLNTVVLVALGAELSVSQAAARAVIYCGDGSTYTLEANEQSISAPRIACFSSGSYSATKTLFSTPRSPGVDGIMSQVRQTART